MTTLQIIATLTDFAYYAWFLATGFLLSACILSHTVRYVRKCRQTCLDRRLDEQINFLMAADYAQLYRQAREWGLVSRRVKKAELCVAIATYQLL